jgi:hypothetical protein
VEKQSLSVGQVCTFPAMHPTPEQKSHTRLIIASALFLLSIATSFGFSFLAHRGVSYWVITHPVAQGSALTSSDLARVTSSIDRSISSYISASENPIGMIARRNMPAGVFIDRRDLAADSGELSTADVSISVRAADMPANVGVGANVSLYHLVDSRNGEVVMDPELILERAFVKEVARKSANFASDITLTITLNERDLPYLLQATTLGRLVVVSTHG